MSWPLPFHPQGRRPASPRQPPETHPIHAQGLRPAAGDLLGGGSRLPPARQPPETQPGGRTLGGLRKQPLVGGLQPQCWGRALGERPCWEPGTARSPKAFSGSCGAAQCGLLGPGGHAAGVQKLGVGLGLRPPRRVAKAAPPVVSVVQVEPWPGAWGLWLGGGGGCPHWLSGCVWGPDAQGEGQGRLAQVPSPRQHGCQDTCKSPWKHRPDWVKHLNSALEFAEGL